MVKTGSIQVGLRCHLYGMHRLPITSEHQDESVSSVDQINRLIGLHRRAASFTIDRDDHPASSVPGWIAAISADMALVVHGDGQWSVRNGLALGPRYPRLSHKSAFDLCSVDKVVVEYEYEYDHSR